MGDVKLRNEEGRAELDFVTGFGANPLKRLDRRQDRRSEASVAAGLEVAGAWELRSEGYFAPSALKSLVS